MTTQAADFIRTLANNEVRELLWADPLGMTWLMEADARGGVDWMGARWFLYDLFLARRAWFRAVVEGKAAAGRQLALL